MTRLSRSVDCVIALLKGADLAADATVRELLELTTQRRSMDLSDLAPAEQATLIAARSQELQPSADALGTSPTTWPPTASRSPRSLTSPAPNSVTTVTG